MHGQHGVLFRDQQVRLFLGILFAVPAMLTLYRWWVSPVPFDPIHNYAATLFNVTSVVTTTGYASEDYSAWGLWPLWCSSSSCLWAAAQAQPPVA